MESTREVQSIPNPPHPLLQPTVLGKAAATASLAALLRELIIALGFRQSAGS